MFYYTFIVFPVSEAISLDETDGIQTDDVHDMAFVIDVRCKLGDLNRELVSNEDK